MTLSYISVFSQRRYIQRDLNHGQLNSSSSSSRQQRGGLSKHDAKRRPEPNAQTPSTSEDDGRAPLESLLHSIQTGTTSRREKHSNNNCMVRCIYRFPNPILLRRQLLYHHNLRKGANITALLFPTHASIWRRLGNTR